jgi:hypothetical protein
VEWASRLIRGTIDPSINHEAPINHDKSTIIALVSEYRYRRSCGLM